MGTQERKEREKAEMKRMILEAAINLFVEEGFENVSIRKIAEKIEYSPASIYTYFNDKGAILFELLQEGFIILKEHQLSIQNIEDPVERLKEHGRVYLKFAIEYPHYYDIMFIMHGTPDKSSFIKDWDCGDRSFGILIQNIVDCQNVGCFKGDAPTAVALFVWSLVHGIATLNIRRGKIIKALTPEYFDDIMESALQILSRIMV